MVVAGGQRARDAVEEWLRFHGCHDTLAAIHREIAAYEEAQDSFGGEATPSYEWRKRAETKMLELLETGRRQLFWTAWEKYVPASIRETDPNLARLEVDLHVYFVVAALSLPKARSSDDGPLVAPFDHNGGVEAERGSGGARGDQREAIDALKIHLDGRGRALVETDIFAPMWATAVRNKVALVLSQILRPPPQPKLAGLVSGGPGGLGGVGGKGSEAEAVMAIAEAALGVARESVAQMDVLLAEQGKDSNPAAARLLEDMRNRLRDVTAQTAAHSKAKRFGRPSSGVVAKVLGQGDQGSVMLAVGLKEAGAPDFALNLDGPGGVKEALAQPDSDMKAGLLQALRWRVTRRAAAGQPHVIAEYVAADVLDTRGGAGLFHALLCSSEPTQAEQFARFLECLSKSSEGRTYLMACNGSLIKEMAAEIKASSGNTRTSRALLQCVQQCSRRSSVQDAAVAAGLVEWLTEQLNAHADTMSAHSAEYMSALLVNLAQRSAGRQKCLQVKDRLLPVLVDMLEHESMRVREYVHGVLYSLLKLRDYMALAQGMGLEDILQALQDVYKSQNLSNLARQVALLLLRVREEEGPEPGPQSDSEDEAPLDTSPARSPAKAKSPSKRGEDGREVAVRDERDVLYAEGPEDRDDLVPDCGEGRGSQLLFSRFLAPGGSWVAMSPTKQASPQPKAPVPIDLASPHKAGTGVSGETSAEGEAHALGAKEAPQEPSASSTSPNKSAAAKPGRYFDEGKGLLGEEGKDWISEEVEAAGGGLDWGGEGDEAGEEPGREGDRSVQGDNSLDGGRRIRTPSQETLQKIRKAADASETEASLQIPLEDEYKQAFGGARALPRTPPRLYN